MGPRPAQPGYACDMHELTQRFGTALGELHQNRYVEPLVALFGAAATALGHVAVDAKSNEIPAARTLWPDWS